MFIHFSMRLVWTLANFGNSSGYTRQNTWMTRMLLLKPRQRTKSLEPAANPAPAQCLARSEGATIMMMKISLRLYPSIPEFFGVRLFSHQILGLSSHGILGISSYRPLFSLFSSISSPFSFSLFDLFFPPPILGISLSRGGLFCYVTFMCFEKHIRALRQAR